MRMESPLNQRLRWSPPDVVYTPIDVTSLPEFVYVVNGSRLERDGFTLRADRLVTVYLEPGSRGRVRVGESRRRWSGASDKRAGVDGREGKAVGQ